MLIDEGQGELRMNHPWPYAAPGDEILPVDGQFILVVDDEPGIREAVAEILELDGYEVATAANGAEALVSIERQTPALILLDMRMPVLNGWEFAQTLQERGLDLPIVVITAATDARAWAQEVAAVDYLAKPFDLMDLLSAVERILPSGRSMSAN
jgi:CheY-like chemotaxis protein